MQFWEVIFICFGLSLDVFGVSVCQGALLGRLPKGKLVGMGGIFCAWQLAALELGLLIGKLADIPDMSHLTFVVWRIPTGCIFLVLCVIFLVKALRRKPLLERLSELMLGHITALAALSSLDALAVGVGIGMLGSFWLTGGLVILVTTAIAVFCGVLVGYYFGYAPKTFGYWAGGVIFAAACIWTLRPLFL